MLTPGPVLKVVHVDLGGHLEWYLWNLFFIDFINSMDCFSQSLRYNSNRWHANTMDDQMKMTADLAKQRNYLYVL